MTTPQNKDNSARSGGGGGGSSSPPPPSMMSETDMLHRCVSRVIDLEQNLANQIAELLTTEKSYRKLHGTSSSSAAAGAGGGFGNPAWFQSYLNSSTSNTNNTNNNNATSSTPQQQQQQQTNPFTTTSAAGPLSSSPSQERPLSATSNNNNPGATTSPSSGYVAFSTNTPPTTLTPNNYAINNSNTNTQQQQQQQQQQHNRARRRSSTSFVGLPPIGQPDIHQPMTSPLSTSPSSINNIQNINNNNNNSSPTTSNLSSTNNSASPHRSSLEPHQHQQQQIQQFHQQESNNNNNTTTTTRGSSSSSSSSSPVTNNIVALLPSALQSAEPLPPNRNNSSVSSNNELLNNTHRSLNSTVMTINNNNSGDQNNNSSGDFISNNNNAGGTIIGGVSHTSSGLSRSASRPQSATTSPQQQPTNSNQQNKTVSFSSSSPSAFSSKQQEQHQQFTPQPQKSVTFFGTSLESEGMRNATFVRLRRAAVNTTVKLIRALTRCIIFDFASQAKGEMSLLPLNLDPMEMRTRLKILTSMDFRVNKLRLFPLSKSEKDAKSKFDFEDEIWREALLRNSEQEQEEGEDENNNEDGSNHNNHDRKVGGREPFFVSSTDYFLKSLKRTNDANQRSTSTRRRSSSADAAIYTSKAFDDFEYDERVKADRKIKDIDVLARLALTNMKQTDWYDPKYEVSVQKRIDENNNNNKHDVDDTGGDTEEDMYLLLPGEKERPPPRMNDGDEIIRKLPILPKSKNEGVAESSVRYKREEREFLRIQKRQQNFLYTSGNNNKNEKSGIFLMSSSSSAAAAVSLRLPSNPSIDAVWAQVFAYKNTINASRMSRRESFGGGGAAAGQSDRNFDRSDPRLRSRSPAASLFGASSSVSSSASNWSGDPIARLCRCSEVEMAREAELQEKRRVQSIRDGTDGDPRKRRWSIASGSHNPEEDMARASRLFESRRRYSGIGLGLGGDDNNNNNINNKAKKFISLEDKLEAKKKRDAKKGKIMGSSFRKLSPSSRKNIRNKKTIGLDDDMFGEQIGDDFDDHQEGGGSGKLPIIRDGPSASSSSASRRKLSPAFSSTKRSDLFGRRDQDQYGDSGSLTPIPSAFTKASSSSPGRKLVRVSSSSLDNKRKSTTTSANTVKTPSKPNTARPSGKKASARPTPKKASSPNNRKGTSTSRRDQQQRTPSPPSGTKGDNNTKQKPSSASSPSSKKNDDNKISTAVASSSSPSSAASILAAAQQYRHVKYRRRHHDAVTILATWWRSRLACEKVKRMCQRKRERRTTVALVLQRFGNGFRDRRRLALMKRGIELLHRCGRAKFSELLTVNKMHGKSVVQRYEGWKTMVTLNAKRFLARREVRKRQALMQEYTDHRLDLERNDDEVIVITLQWRYDTLLQKLCAAWGVVDSSWKRSAMGALNSALEDRRKKQMKAIADGGSTVFRRGVTGEIVPFSAFEQQRRKSLVRFAEEIGAGNEEIAGRFAPAAATSSSSRSNSRRGSAVTSGGGDGQLVTTTSSSGDYNYYEKFGLGSSQNPSGAEFTRHNSSSNSLLVMKRMNSGGGAVVGSPTFADSVKSNNDEDIDLSPSMRLAAIDAVKRARFGATMLKAKRSRAALKIQKVFRAFWARKFIVSPLKEVKDAMNDFKNCGRLHVHISDKLAIRHQKGRERQDVLVRRRLKDEAEKMQLVWSPLMTAAAEEVSADDDDDEQKDKETNPRRSLAPWGTEEEEAETQKNNNNNIQTSPSPRSPKSAKTTPKNNNVSNNNKHRLVRFEVIEEPDDDDNSHGSNHHQNDDEATGNDNNKQSHRHLHNHHRRQHHQQTHLAPSSPFTPSRATLEAADEILASNRSLAPGMKFSSRKLLKIERETAAEVREEIKKTHATPSKLEFVVQAQERKDWADPERREQYHRFLVADTHFFQDHKKLPVVSKM